MNNYFSTTEEMWHKKDKSPEIGKWILVEIDTQYSQRYKVFNYAKPNCLVTGNYPNPSYTLQNWDETPIVRWIYLDTLIDEHTIDANKMMGLDEAAVEYLVRYDKENNGEDAPTTEAFKAGAKWRDEQIPELTYEDMWKIATMFDEVKNDFCDNPKMFTIPDVTPEKFRKAFGEEVLRRYEEEKKNK